MGVEIGFDLARRPEHPVNGLAQEGGAETQNESDGARNSEHDERQRTALVLRRSGRTDNPRLGNRKRLLLNCLHVSLQETVVERVINLGRAFEVAQPQPVAIDDLRVGDQTFEVSFETFDARFCDFVVALVALGDAAEFVEDRSTQLGHLGAQIDRRQMVGAISRRPDGLFRGKIEILFRNRLMTSL